MSYKYILNITEQIIAQRIETRGGICMFPLLYFRMLSIQTPKRVYATYIPCIFQKKYLRRAIKRGGSAAAVRHRPLLSFQNSSDKLYH